MVVAPNIGEPLYDDAVVSMAPGYVGWNLDAGVLKSAIRKGRELKYLPFSHDQWSCVAFSRLIGHQVALGREAHIRGIFCGEDLGNPTNYTNVALAFVKQLRLKATGKEGRLKDR